MQNIRYIAMSKIACGLDKMDCSEISTILYNVFNSSGIKTYVYVSKAENNQMPSYTQYTDESIEEIFGFLRDEIVNKCKYDAEIATDFSNDAKSLCKPNKTEQFQNSEQTNKTTLLFMKLFKKDSTHGQKMQVKTMHTISRT